MSNYKTIHTKNSLFKDNTSAHSFLERYFTQLCDMHKTSLDFITIWFQFCKVNNLVPRKPWQISSNDLQNLDRLADDEIFLLIGEGIGRFWKGEGF